MTGIERHWKEIDEQEREAKTKQLSVLSQKVRALELELNPQQWYFSQQAQALGVYSGALSTSGLLSSLIGGASSAYGEMA